MQSSPSVPPEPDLAADGRTALDQRRAVLGPSLAAMGFTEHGGPPASLPQQLQLDGLAVALEPWERNVLLGQFKGETEIILAHLAEGIAFRARCQSTLLRLEHAPPQEQETDGFLGEMIEHTAAGLALQQEVQRDIDRLVGKGELADAKRLTGFRRKIDHGLSGLKQRMGDQAHEQAQARSVEMLTPRNWEPASRKKAQPRAGALDLPASPQPEPVAQHAPALAESTPEKLFEQGLCEQERHKAQASTGRAPTVAVGPTRAEESGGRTLKRLIRGLALTVVAYGVFLAVSRPSDLPPRLEMNRFEQFDEVLRVRPRPPSLFIRLDTASWRALGPAERLELMNDIGRVAGDEGYFGVHAKTSDGNSVGQWMRKTGAELIETAPGG